MRIQVSTSHGNVEASGSIILGERVDRFAIQVENVVYEAVFEGFGDIPEVLPGEFQPQRAVIRLVNFNNPLGTSYIAPSVGTINGRSITLAFYVQSLGEFPKQTRLVNFTVYSGPPAI